MSEVVENEQKVSPLRKKTEERAHELQQLQATLATQEAALDHLKQEINQREEALSFLRRSLAEYDELLEASHEEDDQPDEYKIALALTLSNVAYDALLVVDEDTRILASNESAESLFNNPRPRGRMLVDVTELPELESMVMDALANEEESFEEQIVYKKRFYRVRSRVIRRDSNLFIGLALQDVSELVRLNRARRDMVANISHELRTPIANIRLIIDSLFHEQDKPKRKQSTSAVRAIARETDSLLWLVQELLDLSMIESGQAILRMVEEPLSEIVAEAVERVEDQSDAKEIEIINEIPSNLQVLADRDQIRRVFINLIHNAIKWSPPREKIRVRASSNDDEVTVNVLDKGPGVPEEFRERIFERFYQVDPARSGGEGTGLGLAICKHIVEAHGGRLWVEDNLETKEGRGGCFKFTLPSA
jgi:two-component system phosphate regulon sensor histidine kinase PhoR